MRDIVENGIAILSYTKGLDEHGYASNALVRDGTERCLSRISEAAVKLGPLAEELFPQHDWLAIRNLGNVLRHDYKSVIDAIVWNIIANRVPPLLAELEAFLANYPEDQETL